MDIAPPFQESPSAVDAREKASSLIMSDLPAYIVGEPGTGRRTMAAGLAETRSRARGALQLRSTGQDGLPKGLRNALRGGRRGRGALEQPPVLVLHHIDRLPIADQVQLSDWVRDRSVLLVSVGFVEDHGERDGPTVVPELRAALEPFRVLLPPLRDRGDDVTQWAKYFLSRIADELSIAPPVLSGRALEPMRRYSWPGNLAQLDSVIRRAIHLGRRHTIEPEDLDLPCDPEPIKPLDQAVNEFRIRYILEALERFGGNRTQAARALGVDARTVFRHLERVKDAG